ncbi:phosphoglycerate kinase [Candidatus Kaiserbacteria bacterium CG10_big_fil_rev_8_21_14_0_10_45_20]|uniref:Phosphoglycerate kinase n=1 Tax=Candidatus Kaiserbacteria bacterium CG10_big_fil_rev_8_21_14_0_10_45_20 TaxID=1974607 RepID=A0A2H0UFF5_9BACT|nr:MAG: phosphoglycerate kinase [Candidatus Kaiserbacteria bacterium CG10_big_fil_rev_8_21_14_0_10_45_20]
MAIRVLDWSQNFSGKSVLVRASLNVPIENGNVTNPFRFERALHTIEALAVRGARVVVVGHIGRASTDSLEVVHRELQKRTTVPIHFVNDVVGAQAQEAVARLSGGEVLLLENVRRDAREIENDDTFAARLASFGELFVNDAFADSHRAHASIVGVPHYIESVAGPRFMEEYNGILPALNPPSPSFAIMGGAKFLTKVPLIKTLLEKYDTVFIGGALANDFFSAKGHEVGVSLVSSVSHAEALLKNSKLITPSDVTVWDGEKKDIKKLSDIAPRDAIYDIGPLSVKAITPYIQKARFILWNGPLGNFEKGFIDGTESVAKVIASASGKSVLGGGDTVASIEHLQLKEKITFISTAGGAMLQFIAEGTLPGIEVLSE